MLHDQYSWFSVLLAVAVAAFALQVSAGSLGGWLPSLEHCKTGTSLYHPQKHTIRDPPFGRTPLLVAQIKRATPKTHPLHSYRIQPIL